MARGQPDFGMYAPKVTVASLSDMAELAARLKALTLFDRRGDVIWWDDFEENAAKWADSYTGGAGTWALSTVVALLGAKSGKLDTAAVVGATAMIRRNLQFLVESKLGFELAFEFGATMYPIEFWIETNDGSNLVTYKVTYNYNTQVLSLIDHLNNPQNIATSLKLIAGDIGFHIFKLVVDMATKKYIRVILDNKEYDVSAYGGYSVASTTAPQVNVHFKTTCASAYATTSYVDNCIITQNEP